MDAKLFQQKNTNAPNPDRTGDLQIAMIEIVQLQSDALPTELLAPFDKGCIQPQSFKYDPLLTGHPTDLNPTTKIAYNFTTTQDIKT
jgi:hypothetical protein